MCRAASGLLNTFSESAMCKAGGFLIVESALNNVSIRVNANIAPMSGFPDNDGHIVRLSLRHLLTSESSSTDQQRSAKRSSGQGAASNKSKFPAFYHGAHFVSVRWVYLRPTPLREAFASHWPHNLSNIFSQRAVRQQLLLG